MPVRLAVIYVKKKFPLIIIDALYIINCRSCYLSVVISICIICFTAMNAVKQILEAIKAHLV